MLSKLSSLTHALASIILILFAFSTSAIAAELNIYSYRSPQLIKPILNAYTAETGTKFNIVHAPKGLAQRLAAEGETSPADLILTVDIARLEELDGLGLLAQINSPVLNANIPARLRDDKGYWFALSQRARVVVVSTERTTQGEITRLEDLAAPKWKGRICTRAGSHVYNRALLASLIAHHGEAKAEDWARKLVANLARRPQGNDRAQAEAIYSGLCDVALINTYYYGLMKFNRTKPEQKKWVKAIRIVFLNQADRGQHVNISGAGVVKTSKRKNDAVAFLEWLTGEKAQMLYTSANYEYPVNPEVAPNAEIRSWGRFITDDLPISTVAKHSPAAQKIIDRVDW